MHTTPTNDLGAPPNALTETTQVREADDGDLLDDLEEEEEERVAMTSEEYAASKEQLTASHNLHILYFLFKDICIRSSPSLSFSFP